jgi:plastocyanin
VRTKRWAGVLLAGGTAAALSIVPTAANAAPSTLTIKVGGDTQVSGVTLEGMRFDAPALKVHKGDMLTFDFRGFHTATLIPAGVGADDWRMDHTGRGGDYSLIQPDTDDSPAAFQFNKAVLFPSDPTCGTSANPCAYSGNTVVNSGAPFSSNSFSVTVNANPGDSFWVLCLIHGMMQMRVSVVADNVATTTQSAINSYAAGTLARDRQEAASLIPKLQKQTRHKTASGHYVWDAYAGYDGDGWGLDGMFPRTLHILKGQTVRWHFAQLTGNVHTVTFPRSSANSFANSDFAGTNVKCEGASGDTKADAAPPTFCSNGGVASAEFELRANAVLPHGTHSYAGTGLHSSGIGGEEAGSVRPYDLRFTKRSIKTGWKYACAVHGSMMSGAVIVK